MLKRGYALYHKRYVGLQTAMFMSCYNLSDTSRTTNIKLMFFMYKQRVHTAVKCKNFESWHQQRVTAKVKRRHFGSWHQPCGSYKFTHDNVWTKYSEHYWIMPHRRLETRRRLFDFDIRKCFGITNAFTLRLRHLDRVFSLGDMNALLVSGWSRLLLVQ